MGTLDEIMQLKNQGRTDTEIARELQERGISPREINESLSQAQIKSAVNSPGEELQPSVIQQNTQGEYSAPQNPETEYNEEINPPTPYESQTQEMGETDYSSPQQQYYSNSPQNYSTGSSTDNLIEIAEQVFSEKISEIKNSLDELNNFKELTKSKLTHMDVRLRKIETMIDRLQLQILNKVGSYGEDLQDIKKEMSMMQDSFGKVINPLTDKKSHSHTPPKHKKKSKK